ncbi:hypothetical protein BDN72DRAFT_840194 [Pluteus cervinus]|uniref:Uncharacterized protein n=1 Tax=Pluteus cervinus TaxID=181527 RepID=A0ACD3AV36_9AGAR|nr:hypothetical protein BDN72DRAFT_840194 [Pluteus cervinus]
MSDSPIFPPEIEYNIFTIALEPKLENNGRDVVDLILVAKRVYEWLIPKIFQTLAVQRIPPSRKYPLQWQLNSLEIYGKHVQHLFVWMSAYYNGPISQDQYICLCPNITNLVLWTQNHPDRTHLARMSHLPLTHLSTDTTGLPKSTPELYPLFSRITHLTIVNSTLEHERPTRFTSLTHLAIPNPYDKTIVVFILRCYPTLKALVLWEHGTAFKVVGGFKPSVDDPRVVRMNITMRNNNPVRNWLLDVKDGQGVWGLADETVGKRWNLKEALHKTSD